MRTCASSVQSRCNFPSSVSESLTTLTENITKGDTLNKSYQRQLKHCCSTTVSPLHRSMWTNMSYSMSSLIHHNFFLVTRDEIMKMQLFSTKGTMFPQLWLQVEISMNLLFGNFLHIGSDFHAFNFVRAPLTQSDLQKLSVISQP